MTVPTTQPPVTIVPFYDPKYLLGEVVNQSQPTLLDSYNIIIPNPLVGNEAKAGQAAFTQDGVTAYSGGFSADTVDNFIGFFEAQYFNEWDVGSNDGTYTTGNNFKTTVCSQGTIFVYNCSDVTTSTAPSLFILTTIGGSTPPPIVQGTLYQGYSLPADTTGIKVDPIVTVVKGGFQAEGCLVSVLTIQ